MGDHFVQMTCQVSIMTFVDIKIVSYPRSPACMVTGMRLVLQQKLAIVFCIIKVL